MQGLLDKGHVVYTDRYYSSVPLAEELDTNGTGFVGTLVRNRKDLPHKVPANSFKMASNEVRAWRKGEKLVVAWRHEKKQPVVMLSTTFSAAPTAAHVG